MELCLLHREALQVYRSALVLFSPSKSRLLPCQVALLRAELWSLSLPCPLVSEAGSAVSSSKAATFSSRLLGPARTPVMGGSEAGGGGWTASSSEFFPLAQEAEPSKGSVLGPTR